MLVYNITATRSTPRTLFSTPVSNIILNKSNWDWAGPRSVTSWRINQSGANWSILLSVGKFEAYIGDTETSTSKN